MRLADSAIRAGFRLNAYETLASTSDEAMRRAHAGDRGKLWIVAAQQTQGRGRQGRPWSSPPGNVYASLLLSDVVSPALAPQLGFVAGVALARAVETCLGSSGRVAIKWPNDIVHEGAKLAGILIEGARCPDGRFAVVLGFGVNRSSHPDDLPYPATDLFSIGTARPSVDDLVSALSGEAHQGLVRFKRGHGFASIREEWLGLALPRGTSLSVATRSVRARGKFLTIDDRGRLVIETEKGDLTVEAGDVFLSNPPAQSPRTEAR